MPRLFSAALLVLLLALIGGVVALAGTMSYTIKYGDTLSELAVAHDTDVEALAELNGIHNPDLIIAGDELLIPVDDESTGPERYTVRPGDTLSTIALAHGVDVHELAAWNNLDDPDLIVTGDTLALPAATVEPSEASQEAAVDNKAEESDEAEDEEAEIVDDPIAQPAGNEEPPTGVEALSSGPQPVRLHLVKAGENLDAIASSYDVSVQQIVAANAMKTSAVAPGTILKIPPADLSGIQLVGMPASQEQWPLQSEIAAASLATSYWGEPVSSADILAAIPSSPNPHLGFRGDPQGMWGGIEDYGVYNGPLAEALRQYGFVAEPFYGDGYPDALRASIDAGSPVVVWVTFGLAKQERSVVEDELGRYSLIPEQHALTVYGYDEDGVYAVDVASGEYIHAAWEPFLASWSLFDGMALAISVEDAG